MKKTATRRKPKSAVRQQSKPARRGGRSRKSSSESVAWIRSLAAPYLKGYKPMAANRGGLRGYWFLASPRAQVRKENLPPAKSPVSGQSAGFFVGYLTSGDGYSFFSPEPPECLVFAWISPVAGALHQRLVVQPGSLVRKTFEYIRWLTHRPPRFVFHEKELPAMARHGSMRAWPQEKHRHLSQNFFIETLAWLVRSGLVTKLKERN
ncbi:MAG: hypothetical protein ACRD4A_00825 [Candidatus Acidiferrales bacterium]